MTSCLIPCWSTYGTSMECNTTAIRCAWIRQVLKVRDGKGGGGGVPTNTLRCSLKLRTGIFNGILDVFHWVQAHLCPCDTEDTIAVGKDSNHEAMINNVGSTVCEILVSAPALYSDASSATDRGPDISDLRVL